MLKKEAVSCEVIFNDRDWERIDTYFKGYAGVDPSDVPEKYAEYVVPCRTIMKNEAKVLIKYCVADVTGTDETGIHLENGEVFDGPIIQKAYEGIEQTVLFVTSVINMDEVMARHDDDQLNSFFLDFWGVGMLNTSREKLQALIAENLEGTGYEATSVWSPGQARFELKNQKPLFATLKPEDIGVILDKFTRMVPLKTVSGTMGIVKSECKADIVSCDYCEYRETCPGYIGTKLKDRKNVRIG